MHVTYNVEGFLASSAVSLGDMEAIVLHLSGCSGHMYGLIMLGAFGKSVLCAFCELFAWT